jgi:glycyl-radical enzyme activating protein
MSIKADRNQKGRIFNIQFFCVHDGPGIRTTVFLKGCPLRCIWCHNPEGISPDLHLSYSEAKCISCGACTRVCEAHKIVDGKHVLDRSLCTGRMDCVKACPSGALSQVGKDVTVDEVMKDVVRDRQFYEPSGGGVTFSGGEPFMQPKFLLNLILAAKEEGLHVAVETSGVAAWSVYESVLPHVDLFMYDCKETDPALHKEFTGADNRLILENLRKLHDAGAKILLRCPVVIGLNDRDGHLRGIADLSSTLPNLQGVEILPYHNLAASKTARMGLESQKIYETPTAQIKKEWNEKLAAYGAPVIEP